jgi:hypothetical protein
MKHRTGTLKLYTVVEVWRGIAESAKNYRRLKDAQKYMRRLRRGRNMAEDDVQLFESSVRISVGSVPSKGYS